MQLSVAAQGDVYILTPSGTIYAGDDVAFGKALGDLRRDGRFTVVINVAELEYINSRAIGQLVQFSRDARLAGGKVVIVRPGPNVEKVLKAVGLLSLIPCFDSVAQAVAACRQKMDE
jgi:anti-anti-sigma factor